MHFVQGVVFYLKGSDNVIPGWDQESKCWVHTVFSQALYCHLDKVPGPSQGWRVAGIVQDAILQGKTQAGLLGKTQVRPVR